MRGDDSAGQTRDQSISNARRNSTPSDCPILSAIINGATSPGTDRAGMRIGTILGGVMAGLAAAFASGTPAYAASPLPLTDPVAARLLPGGGAGRPGGALLGGLHLRIAPGWHTHL